MSHPLDGPRLKIKRAEKHIGDLKAEIAVYLGREPYERFSNVEPATREPPGMALIQAVSSSGGSRPTSEDLHRVVRVRIREYPPVEWAVWIGEILHDLRSALDLLAYQIVPSDNTEFPISISSQQFETGLRRKVKGAGRDAVRLFRAAKPYKGGNDALWTLHRLNIADKHHLLIPVGLAVPSVIVEYAPDIGPRVSTRLYSKAPTLLLKDGTEIWRDMTGTYANPMNMNIDFDFEVAFGEGEVVKGQAVVPTLLHLAQATQSVVEAFAALWPPHDDTAVEGIVA